MILPGPLQTLVVAELQPGVVQVLLNRPDRLNAIDEVMCAELQTVFAWADTSGGEAGEVRVLVLRGAGRGFCSGGDLREVARIFRPPAALAERAMRQFQAVTRCLVDLSVPTVACVHGAAAGGGLVLAAACDLRIAAQSARFAMSFVDRGLGLDMGGSHVVSRLIGRGRTAQMALLGEVIDASRAEALGLVNFVVPEQDLDRELQHLIAALASKSPVATRLIKSALQSADPGLEAALRYEAAAQALAFSTLSADAPPAPDPATD